jgi:hypothetical protein
MSHYTWVDLGIAKQAAWISPDSFIGGFPLLDCHPRRDPLNSSKDYELSHKLYFIS